MKDKRKLLAIPFVVPSPKFVWDADVIRDGVCAGSFAFRADSPIASRFIEKFPSSVLHPDTFEVHRFTPSNAIVISDTEVIMYSSADDYFEVDTKWIFRFSHEVTREDV